VVDAFYVHGIVTEMGVFDPEAFALEMHNLLDLGKRQLPFMGLLDSLRKRK